MTFKKFPSIEQLHTIAREALKYGKAGDKTFISKVKLQGTNACVQIHPDGSVKAQKRSGMITPEHDNFDFAKWTEKNADWFKNIFLNFAKRMNGVVYVHGEWAGQGIQKSDAVSMCRRMFYIFMLEFPDGTTIIEQLPPFLESNPDVAWIPPYRYYDNVNFFDDLKMSKFVEQIENDITEISSIDPYIKLVHDIEGPGEGLVFYPIPFDPTLIFKVKTEAHMENKRKDLKIVSYTPETVKEIEDFADKYCTEPRYQQALTELGIRDTFSIKDTGRFIGWVCKDVYKECPSEAEFNGFTWKDVATIVTNKARYWFLKQVQ